ncbi:MAG: hypothetical protein ACKV2U_28645, partial [Bryobacteraceae bacterium]
FFNLGPVNMPMSKGEILMVLSSQFQPNKFGNATEIVGALHQDRHSGIMGVLGDTSPTVPVSVKVRSYDAQQKIIKEKDLKFNIFVQQKWTPFLMMLTMFNSIEGLNDFADDVTFRLNGQIELDGASRPISLRTMQAPSELPIPAPMVLAGWWGDKFNRLFGNQLQTPNLKRVTATIDLIPERRTASIETAWLPASEVEPGAELPLRVFLRPYRGERLEREVKFNLPADLPRGDHRILISDADTLNRIQTMAAMSNRFIDLPQTIALINQERSNNRLYVSLIEQKPTVYADEKVMPGLPASVLNVMQSARTGGKLMLSTPETAVEKASLDLDQVVQGAYSLKITVR